MPPSFSVTRPGYFVINALVSLGSWFIRSPLSLLVAYKSHSHERYIHQTCLFEADTDLLGLMIPPYVHKNFTPRIISAVNFSARMYCCGSNCSRTRRGCRAWHLTCVFAPEALLRSAQIRAVLRFQNFFSSQRVSFDLSLTPEPLYRPTHVPSVDRCWPLVLDRTLLWPSSGSHLRWYRCGFSNTSCVQPEFRLRSSAGSTKHPRF